MPQAYESPAPGLAGIRGKCSFSPVKKSRRRLSGAGLASWLSQALGFCFPSRLPHGSKGCWNIAIMSAFQASERMKGKRAKGARLPAGAPPFQNVLGTPPNPELSPTANGLAARGQERACSVSGPCQAGRRGQLRHPEGRGCWRSRGEQPGQQEEGDQVLPWSCLWRPRRPGWQGGPAGTGGSAKLGRVQEGPGPRQVQGSAPGRGSPGPRASPPLSAGLALLFPLPLAPRPRRAVWGRDLQPALHQQPCLLHGGGRGREASAPRRGHTSVGPTRGEGSTQSHTADGHWMGTCARWRHTRCQPLLSLLRRSRVCFCHSPRCSLLPPALCRLPSV